jgi:hypothetical protein
MELLEVAGRSMSLLTVLEAEVQDQGAGLVSCRGLTFVLDAAISLCS